MKRIFSVFIIFCVLFSISACAESANMSELTAYQNGDFCAEASIAFCDESYTAEIEKRGERLTFRFKEPKKLAAFSFIFTKESASIATEGIEIPLQKSEFLKISELANLFSVPTEGAWKIKRASPGGVDVFVCQNGDTVLYIDANSYLPLKISVQGAVADILCFTKE